MTMSSEENLTVSLTLTAVQSSPRVPLVIDKKATPSELRLKAAEATKIPLSSLKLIFRGRLIADDETNDVVSEYKLEDDCVLHCMGKPVESQETASAAATATPATSTVPAGSSVSFRPQPAAAPAALSAAGGGQDPLQAALNTLRSSNSASVYLTAVTTLDKVLSNCIDHPLEEKYRRVKKQNAAFQRRLGGLHGGDAAMMAAGFVLEGQGSDESYILKPSPEAWPKLLDTKNKVSAAMAEAQSAAGSAVPPPPAAAAAAGFGGASMPPMSGLGAGMPGMGAGVPPNMQNAMQNLMSDPNALQSMLQVRMRMSILIVITIVTFPIHTTVVLPLDRIQWCATCFKMTLVSQTTRRCVRAWRLSRPIRKCSIKSVT